MVGGKLDHQVVEPLGRCPGPDVRHQHVERACGKLTGPGHALESIAAVDLDLGFARLGAEDVEVVHEALRFG